MSKPKLKLAFCDFWPGFDPAINFFTNLLASRYDIEFSDDPEFLIYSCYGYKHHRYKCVKIFFAPENRRPDFSLCDAAFSFDHLDHPRHYRLPLYVLSCSLHDLVKQEFDAEAHLAAKTGFCSFVQSNPACPKRNRFFHKLSRYKRIDSGGRHWNNVGGPVADKQDFMSRYKFNFAFENGSHPGYTTEKLTDAMLAGSLPIYWGNPLVHQDFNTHSFLNYYDYGSDEALIARIVELDRNDDIYLQYLRQSWLPENRIPESFASESIIVAFDRIFARATPGVARSPYYVVHRARNRIAGKCRRILSYARQGLRLE